MGGCAGPAAPARGAEQIDPRRDRPDRRIDLLQGPRDLLPRPWARNARRRCRSSLPDSPQALVPRPPSGRVTATAMSCPAPRRFAVLRLGAASQQPLVLCHQLRDERHEIAELPKQRRRQRHHIVRNRTERISRLSRCSNLAGVKRIPYTRLTPPQGVRRYPLELAASCPSRGSARSGIKSREADRRLPATLDHDLTRHAELLDQKPARHGSRATLGAHPARGGEALLPAHFARPT